MYTSTHRWAGCFDHETPLGFVHHLHVHLPRGPSADCQENKGCLGNKAA